MMNRARSAPACSTIASSESIHSWVSTGSMSGSCCLNWSKTSCIGRSIGTYGTDRCAWHHCRVTGSTPHRVLVLGGGFAGMETVKALERRLGRRRDVEIWLVSRDDFMLFTPLLPEVCSGVLEPRHVVIPLRGMLRRPSSWCITG